MVKFFRYQCRFTRLLNFNYLSVVQIRKILTKLSFKWECLPFLSRHKVNHVGNIYKLHYKANAADCKVFHCQTSSVTSICKIDLHNLPFLPFFCLVNSALLFTIFILRGIEKSLRKQCNYTLASCLIWCRLLRVVCLSPVKWTLGRSCQFHYSQIK